MRIRLTPRDSALLLDCYHHTVLSFSQIHERHFESRSAVTVSNRLKRLSEGGFLCKQRVALPLYLEKPKEVGAVFQVTRVGQECLKRVYPKELIRDAPVPLNPASLVHDLHLNEALAALAIRFPDARQNHGRLIQTSVTKGRRPDAVLQLSDVGVSVAVELELNTKSEARYRQIVMQYRLNSDYSAVLYIVASESIANKIKYQITQQRGPVAGVSVSTGKFYFVLLSDLLKHPGDVSVTNGSQELVVKNP